MKAITLWQPWASFVGLGVKTIETRSWSTRYRGPLAIHAGSRRPPMMTLPPLIHSGTWAEQDAHNYRTWHVCETIHDPAFHGPQPAGKRVPKSALSPTLFFPREGPFARPHREGTSAIEQGSAMYLPLGSVIATCELVEVVPTESLYWTELWPDWAWQGSNGAPLYPPQNWLSVRKLPIVSPVTQRPFGDFAPGRFAWLLDDVQPIEPVPAKGHQGLWEWST
jgi:hypothetical protein